MVGELLWFIAHPGNPEHTLIYDGESPLRWAEFGGKCRASREALLLLSDSGSQFNTEPVA